jgi:hypothetical protein
MRVEGTGKPPGCKLIRFSAELEGETIRTISIRGDFLASPEEGFDRAERRLWGTACGDLERTFDRLLAEEGVETLGINGAALARVFQEALAAAPKTAVPPSPVAGAIPAADTTSAAAVSTVSAADTPVRE